MKASRNKPSVFYLITGYLNTRLTDGATTCLLTLLERLHNDGFDVHLINLTNKSLLCKTKQLETRTVSRSNVERTFYLQGYSFPVTLHFCAVDISDAYRHCQQSTFNRLADEWRNIIKARRCDAAITADLDVFSMAASLECSAVRLHMIRAVWMFKEERMPHAAYFRTIMPQFRFVPGGTFLQQKLRAQYGRVGINLPPLVDYKKFTPRAHPKKYISMICRSLSQKGFCLFLNIAKNMPEKEFLLKADIEAKVLFKNANIHNVKVVPWVQDINAIYDETRILLVPSLWEESFGMVIAEAMACGIPVIANDVGGVREALNGAGLLVKINEGLRERQRFCTDITHHLDALASYIKQVRFLDDPHNYQAEVKRSLRAAEQGRGRNEKYYANFAKKLASYINKTE